MIVMIHEYERIGKGEQKQHFGLLQNTKAVIEQDGGFVKT